MLGQFNLETEIFPLLSIVLVAAKKQDISAVLQILKSLAKAQLYKDHTGKMLPIWTYFLEQNLTPTDP